VLLQSCREGDGATIDACSPRHLPDRPGHLHLLHVVVTPTMGW
jgi:hypothetical protein